ADAPPIPLARASPPSPANSSRCRREMPLQSRMVSPPMLCRLYFMMRACASSLLLRGHRHRHARNLHVDRAEVAAAGEVKRLPVVAAEGDVGGRGLPVNDAAEFLAGRVENPEAAGAAAIDVAGAVHLD